MDNVATDINTYVNVQSNIDRRNEFSFWQIVLVMVGIVVVLVLLAFNRTVTRFKSIFEFYNGSSDALKQLLDEVKDATSPLVDVLEAHNSSNCASSTTSVSALGFALQVGWKSAAALVPSNSNTNVGVRLCYSLVSSNLIMTQNFLCGNLIVLEPLTGKDVKQGGPMKRPSSSTLKSLWNDAYKHGNEWNWTGGMWSKKPGGGYAFITRDQNPPHDFMNPATTDKITPDNVAAHYNQALRVANPLFYLYRASDIKHLGTFENGKDLPPQYMQDVTSSDYDTTAGFWNYVAGQTGLTASDLFKSVFSPVDKGCTQPWTFAGDAFGGGVSGAMGGAPIAFPYGMIAGFFAGALSGIVGDISTNASKKC